MGTVYETLEDIQQLVDKISTIFTTYLPLVDIFVEFSLQKQKLIYTSLTFSLPPTYVPQLSFWMTTIPIKVWKN